MALSEQSLHYRVEENEHLCESGRSGSKSYNDAMSYNFIEETRGKRSHISINKKSKARIVEVADSDNAEIVVPELDETDGQREIKQCKIYPRKHGLRLTGNKETLIQRIKEHLEILNGGGEKKYPVSSFIILNCKDRICLKSDVKHLGRLYVSRAPVWVSQDSTPLPRTSRASISSHQLPHHCSEKPFQTQNLVSALNSANDTSHSKPCDPNQASQSERLYIHNQETQYKFYKNHNSFHNGYPAPYNNINTHLNKNGTKGFSRLDRS